MLLFLVQTVGRQHIEQRQYQRRGRSTVVRKSSSAADADPAMPEHDLEPPKFARKALERILNDWTAVKAMLMTGYSRGQKEEGRCVPAPASACQRLPAPASACQRLLVCSL